MNFNFTFLSCSLSSYNIDLPSLSAMSFVSCSLDSVALYLETNMNGLFFTTSATTNDEIIRLVPVLVGLDVRSAGVGVVEAGDVEHLELLVLQTAHRLHGVFLLRPVHIVALEGEPATISGDEHDASSHDDEKGLKSNVVLETLDAQSLHQPQVIVRQSATFALKIGMISSSHDL